MISNMQSQLHSYTNAPLFEQSAGQFEKVYQPKLWTLQMIRYRTEELFQIMLKLGHIETIHRDRSELFSDGLVTQAEKDELCPLLMRLLGEFSDLGMLELVSHIGGIDSRCSAPKPYRSSALHVELRSLREAVDLWLTQCVFLLLGKGKEDFYGKDALWGKRVNDVFPQAKADIREAGNCYAVDQHTACVMHLMRVLEVGLSALATDLDVPSANRNWENIINDIEAAIKKVSGPSWGPNWKDKSKFYSEAAQDFRYFKNAFRNCAMHASEHYKEREASLIMDHVKSFMIHLVNGGIENIS